VKKLVKRLGDRIQLIFATAVARQIVGPVRDDHSPSFNVQVKNLWSFASILIY
jgi:hypothetical protein